MKFSAARFLQHMPVVSAVFCAALLPAAPGTVWADSGTAFAPVSAAVSVPPVSVSFETGISLLAGTVREYVERNGNTVSRLDWRMSGVPVLSAAGTASVWGAELSAGFSAAIPVKSGVMEDFDFLLAQTSAASHYSRHDLYTDRFADISVSAGWRARFGRFSVRPALGFRYRSVKWTAKDGYSQYPASGAWTGTEEKKAFSGSVISYGQVLRLPYFALEASFEARREVGFSVNAAWYPYVIADALDTHFLRSTRFFDSMRGGFGVAAGGTMRLFNVRITLTYEYMSVRSGVSASSSTDYFYPVPIRSVTPGYDSSLWRAAISYRWQRRVPAVSR